MTVLAPEDISRLFGIDLDHIDCAGVKLTLYKLFKLGSRGELYQKTKNLPKYIEIPCRGNLYFLEPGPYLVKYNEYIRIPNGYIGLAIQRSSLIRMGTTLYTAVWDPGYKGRGSGLIVVYNPHGIVLEKNTQLAQLILIKMSRETKKIYQGSYLGEK